jgi:hypothetical protein
MSLEQHLSVARNGLLQAAEIGFANQIHARVNLLEAWNGGSRLSLPRESSFLPPIADTLAKLDQMGLGWKNFARIENDYPRVMYAELNWDRPNVMVDNIPAGLLIRPEALYVKRRKDEEFGLT